MSEFIENSFKDFSNNEVENKLAIQAGVEISIIRNDLVIGHSSPDVLDLDTAHWVETPHAEWLMDYLWHNCKLQNYNGVLYLSVFEADKLIKECIPKLENINLRSLPSKEFNKRLGEALLLFKDYWHNLTADYWEKEAQINAESSPIVLINPKSLMESREFERAVNAAKISKAVKSRLMWIWEKASHTVSHQAFILKYKVSDDAIRAFSSRNSKLLQKTGWDIINAGKCLTIKRS